VNLTREVEIDNALAGNLAFLTNAKVRAKLAVTPRQSSGVEGSWILPEASGELFGYPMLVSNAASSTLTKGSSSGVCSAMFFGNWSELIVGQWSGIDLLSDPYTFSSSGSLRVRALADLDIAVKHAESFAVVSDYLT
jgi:HK97 family phage major capsid protein